MSSINFILDDDEKLLADSTAEYFNLFGVRTAVAYDTLQCRQFLEENSADLLLLDINLEEESGFELCKELRTKTQIPILFISARSSDDDKIIALNIGGDDYIQKPYSLGVLLAKVKAVLKRYGRHEDTGYSDGWLSVDFHTRQVSAGGNLVKLTVEADWHRIETHRNITSLDYTVLDNEGTVRFRTKPGLSESIHEAVIHQDTILDIETDDASQHQGGIGGRRSTRRR